MIEEFCYFFPNDQLMNFAILIPMTERQILQLFTAIDLGILQYFPFTEKANFAVFHCDLLQKLTFFFTRSMDEFHVFTITY